MAKKAAPQKTEDAVPKYLIVQKLRGKIFTYKETAAHYEIVEGERQVESLRLDPKMLEYECDLSAYGDNVYFVFNLA